MGSDDIQNLFVPRDQPLSSGSAPPETMTFPPPQSFPSSPILSFDSFQPQFEFKAGGESSSVAPKPLDSLHETPIPPFLSKTYDLVDDSSLDCIISWGKKGDSFVVWEPLEFARIILPRNFKHNNFSSFVRQLNTYGFRKIDTDKWEFANEGFVRGQRHLLKTIQRRRSHQLQQFGGSSGSSNEAALEGEIKDLRRERSMMMQEVVELQHQQRGTVQHIEAVNEKLEASERGQKQVVSFLAKMFENPAFLARISQLREQQKSIISPRTKRKFVEHQPNELGTSSSSPREEILKYQPELCNFTATCVTSDVPFQVEDCAQDELDMVNELLHTPEKGETVPNMETTDPLLEQNIVINPLLQSANEDSLMMETSIPEFSIAGTESMVGEDARSVDFEAGGVGAGMSTSTLEPWDYNVCQI